jgi:diguanylate cyclase (GGDEF)-like protein
MQRVLRRLETMMPEAEVGIVEFKPTGSATAVCHRHGGALRVQGIGAALLVTDADGWHAWRAGDQRPDWLLRLPMAAAAHLLSLKVTAREELLAWIVIGLPSGTPLDDSTRREVGELRDRIGVTLTAARRERQLIERAATDSLTHLLSRAGLADAMQTCLESPGGGRALPHTLLFVDLDRFKDVNDHLGHQAGDELLCVIAARLAACAPAGSLLARPGGDEFVVVAPGTPEQAAAVAARICEKLAEPVALRGHVVAVGASVGLARYPAHGTTLVDLLRRADMAMYQAKASGRGRSTRVVP